MTTTRARDIADQYARTREDVQRVMTKRTLARATPVSHLKTSRSTRTRDPANSGSDIAGLIVEVSLGVLTTE